MNVLLQTAGYLGLSGPVGILLGLGGIFILTGLLLWWLNRRPGYCYECWEKGKFTLRPTAGVRCYCQHPIGPWTPSHFFHGGFFYAVARCAFAKDWDTWMVILAVLAFEALWEIVENTKLVIMAFHKANHHSYWGDSVANSIGDMLACLLGACALALFI